MPSWPTPGVHRHAVGPDQWDVYLYGQDGRSRLGRIERWDADGRWHLEVTPEHHDLTGRPRTVRLPHSFLGVMAATAYIEFLAETNPRWRLECFEARRCT